MTDSVERLPVSASLRDLRASVEAAALVGCRVYHIPPDFEECGTAENALSHVPAAAAPTPGTWIGYIASPERYSAIYDVGLARNIRLVNSPDQFRRAMEFDLAYPHLNGLTPESLVITARDQAAEAGVRLGYPVFVKGAIQSHKELGLRACVAADPEELAGLAHVLLGSELRSRGRVVVRRFVRLRHVRTSGLDLPLGREFRVFVYGGQPLEHGYYWEGDDPLSHLSPNEEQDLLRLASLAAQRLGVPYVTLDIGQIESGEWTVIECGDGQFSGLSRVSPLRLWNKLRIAAMASAAH